MVPIPISPPPFPQRLVNKMVDGKYRLFITMLKQISLNVVLIKALEKILAYFMFMKDMVKSKRLVSLEGDEKMQHGSVIVIRSLV